ncbi:MAG TPA: RNA polymerase sigma factor [Candidatus Limnocylindrales bacterium]|nr:RNA polymerase sigma factor [Candidatus Limnocylindrales bacterium]
MEQRDLVVRAASGDREAFASLATAHVDRCYGLAYRILRDQDRAQDAAQQALLGAWRDLPTLREAEHFEAWLYRLVVHACYAESRSTRRWNARLRVVAPTHDTSPDPASSVADRAVLEDAFAQLSPEQRAVVVLHHHPGYRLTEIAETLGIPVGTARSRLHYAVRQLRIALDADSPSGAAREERPA